MLAGLASLVGLAFWLNYSSNSRSTQSLQQHRAALAGAAAGPIEVGIIWTDSPEDQFLQGVQLAVEEVNQAGGVLLRDDRGKVLTRKLRLRIDYEKYADPKSSVDAALRMAAHPGVVAVVGHSTSDAAIPASVVYEKEGILFLAPVSTSPMLSRHSFQYVLRTTPTDKDFAEKITRSAAAYGLTNAAIMSVRTIYGHTFSEFLCESAESNGVKIVFHGSYPAKQQDFRSIIASLRENKFDAVFVADELPRAATLIKQMRGMGVDQFVIGGDGLDSPDLWTLGGKAADGTMVATVFEQSMITNVNSMAAHFAKVFSDRHHATPNLLAAHGYEAVKLLVEGFEASNTTVPIAVSITMRYTGEWSTLFGKGKFSREGDILGKKLFMKKVTNGQFGPVL